jgi:lactoylglutathione lyase
MSSGKPGIRPVRFNHVGFRCKDIEASIKWYEEVLGFREAFRTHKPDGDLALVYVQFGPDQFIEFFPGGHDGHVGEASETASGYRHLCITVPDLHEALATLKAKGLEIKAPWVGLSGALIYFIDDPDGNKIELAELNAESKTRQAEARAKWVAEYPEEGH